jgi:hypothetical protein
MRQRARSRAVGHEVSPDSMPRRPSSQLTTGPSRWQTCASAGAARAKATAPMRTASVSVRLVLISASRRLISQPYPPSLVTGSRFNGFRATPERSRKSKIALYFQSIVEMAGMAPAVTCKSAPAPSREGPCGEMAEWLKAHAWKACVRETVPWVRIPLSPPPIFGAPISPSMVGPKIPNKLGHFVSCNCT